MFTNLNPLINETPALVIGPEMRVLLGRRRRYVPNPAPALVQSFVSGKYPGVVRSHSVPGCIVEFVALLRGKGY